MSAAKRDIARLLDLTTSFTPDDLVLGGKGAEARLGKALLNATAERTMEGATTLTLDVADDEWDLLGEDELLGSKRLRSNLTLTVDELVFTLAELDKVDGGLSAVFYDQPTVRLGDHSRRMKATRDAMTRAQFFGMLCKAAGVRLYSIDKNVRQPIQALDKKTLKAIADSETELDKARAEKTDKKVKVKGNLTVNGAAMTSSQRTNCGKVLDAANKYGAKGKALKALICAAIVENAFSNSGVANDHESVGIFQAQPGISQGLRPGSTITRAQALDIDYQVAVFLKTGFWVHGGAIQIAKDHPEKSAGDIAYWVEGCAAQYAYRYDKAGPEADKILAAADGIQAAASDADATETRTVIAKYEFAVEKDEDYLEAGKRLAEEVRWRCFSVGTGYVFDSDTTLARADPSIVLVEGEDGVDKIRWTWTRRGVIDEVTVDMRSVPWLAPPGSVAKVEREGPASGEYLVRSITSGLFGEDRTASVTLGKPQKALREPAPETRTVTTHTGGGGSGSGGSANGAKGTVTQAPGANRSGVSMQRPILDFLALMAGLIGSPVVVTTGTNHDQMTTNGNVSDHWTGNAADLGVGGDIRVGAGDAHKGNVYASAALQICGVSKSAADAQARSGRGLDFSQNYTWQGHRVQIGWRTEVGGNHWNHVHVGVAP